MYRKILFLIFFSQGLVWAQTVGLASWYGKNLQGNQTASGEKFNMYDYTASHRTLPFNTIVKVTNLQNGKSVNVRVNDRGPQKKSRIIDLSFQAAKRIGLVNAGVARVSIDVVGSKVVTEKKSSVAPKVSSNRLFYYAPTQSDLASMKEYAMQVSQKPKRVVAQKTKSKVVKVQVLSVATQKAAEEFVEKERRKGYAMQVVSYYSKKFQRVRYRVLLLADSLQTAQKIVQSKVYNGAYIIP